MNNKEKDVRAYRLIDLLDQAAVIASRLDGLSVEVDKMLSSSIQEVAHYRKSLEPPKPVTPDIEQLQEWEEEGGCEATDGCWVEPDGQCEHGHQSWLLELGLI